MRIKPTVVDFESHGIMRRPDYPPRPVGFSIRKPGERRSRYYCWGHPTGNNCTFNDAKRVLTASWNDPEQPLLFHNAKFDVDVAQTHMGMKTLPWHRIHDTQYLLFLIDPHAHSHSLKPSAERLLGMEPDEQDAVREWLENSKIVRKKQKDWGAHIWQAPGTVVGPYADGDVDRTLGLFNLLYPQVVKRGMLPAYDRERKLMPILLENERQGMRVDLRLLRTEYDDYTLQMEQADAWLRKRLRTKNLNVDSDEEFADALQKCKVVTDFNYTPTGKRSVSKKNLTLDMFKDQKVAAVYGYRNRLATCMGTFMKPWLEMAEQSGGLIYTNWNQTRKSDDGGNRAGARTGRMSTNPNFQNIPKDFEANGFKHPTFTDLKPLPLMRRYILPDKGHKFCHRDYNQQELRILAHFEDGLLLQEYNADPRLDVHTYVQRQIAELIGYEPTRSATKILNFGMIYGMGLGKLAAGMETSVEDAKRIKNAQLTAIPGLKDLTKSVSQRGKDGEAIVTWGGREYFCEEPIIKDGRKMTFEYKLLNYLIQGSAADCTKEAIIRYHDVKKRDGRFLVTVHDEINLSVPPGAVKSEMKLLKDVMQSVEFDVPMLSDGKVGKSWGDLTKFKE